MFPRRTYVLWIALLVALALVLSNARAAGGGAPAAGEARYVVKRGDTLWAIAASRYDGDPRSAIWRIQERNGLASAALVPGMTLYLPP